MDRFLSEYDGAALEDDGAYASEDFKSFARKFRNYLKRVLPGYNLVKYGRGHYYVSTFLEKDGRYIYLSYSVPRYGMPVDIHSGEYGFDMKAVLIRNADGPEDYGGMKHANNYCSLATIGTAVPALFDGNGRW